MNKENRKVVRGWSRGFQKMAVVSDFEKGRSDRLRGLPCRSANGAYLDGWYSVKNKTQ